MVLTAYKKKRSFDSTPEPIGGKAADKQLGFVIQKHDASHLHYDFRLEMRGVLKSWAVPKGPSTDPEVKRLAMMVEDHPYDYKDFEGIIPRGNYGAGTVIVWDEGRYEAVGDGKEATLKNKEELEKDLLRQLYSGKLKFRLYGHKLKGDWALVKAPGRGENAWLLMKLKDKYASGTDISLKDKSVQSGKTLDKVRATSRNIYGVNIIQPSTTAKDRKLARPVEYIEKQTKESGKTSSAKGADSKSGNRKKASACETDIAWGLLVSKGKTAPMPRHIKPMLATLVEKPFDGIDWLYEIKWDGYRAVAYLNKGKIDLESRNNISFNEKFTTIREALEELSFNAVLDGEIVAINEKGMSSFQQLQGYFKHGRATSLAYYVFDILWYEGKDLTHLPLVERKRILKAILPDDNPVIYYSDHVVEKGKEFFKVALRKSLEGIMAKKCDSAYVIGRRSEAWLKIKNNQRTEAIICGFTKGRENRKYFGAIILGKYKGKELVYIGHSGSGFNDRELKEMYEKFKPLITDKCPFKSPPKTNMPATWLKPQLICEVKYTEVTDKGILRHPIFMGLREDKKAADEKNVKVAKVPRPSSKELRKVMRNAAPKLTKAPIKGMQKARETESVKSGRNGGLLPPGEKNVTININKRSLTFTNLDKIYWPKEKITKRDMINYYAAVAPYILPYLKDRPQSLNRHPNGINGPSFYQKNVEGKVADWIKTFPYTSESDGLQKEFLVCSDEATLLYMANLGCIELNPWHSRIQHPDNPDWSVIDLDPDGNSYKEVVKVALVVKEVLDETGIVAYPKTSGATGMHILIPLGAKYSYDQSRMLAELIVGIVHNRIPAITSVERSPSKRKKMIYLDFLQNRQIQTIAAPYSLRPKPGATVSMPLHWEELKPSLRIQDFTIYNALDRIKQEGDIFKKVLGVGINLKAVLKSIQDIATG